MESHLNAMLNLVDQLAAIGEALIYKIIIAFILCSLPESYNTLITALETRSEDELTLELVKGKLLDKDRRRKNIRDYLDECENKALKVRSKRFEKVSQKHDKGYYMFFLQESRSPKERLQKVPEMESRKGKGKGKSSNEGKDTHVCFSVKSGNCN